MGAVKKNSKRWTRVTVQNDATKGKMQMQAVNPDTFQQTGGFFNCFLKTSMDGADLIAAGMRFHRRGPALKKDLSPFTRGSCFGVTSLVLSRFDRRPACPSV